MTPVGQPRPVAASGAGQPGLEDELMTALRRARFSRQRAGATSWRTWHDASNPSQILEQFVVASREEHLRQHEHVTKLDQNPLDRIREMTDASHPLTVTHWLALAQRTSLLTPGLRPPARRHRYRRCGQPLLRRSDRAPV